MAGAGGAGAAGAGYVKMICDNLTQAIGEIVNSSHFDKKEILQLSLDNYKKLNLTQAYCLLWQESKDGKVDGKMEIRGGAVCAAVLDLIVLDKVEIEIDPKSLLGYKYENTLLKVKNDSPTGTFLDDALFNKILEHNKKSFDKPKEVQHYMENDIFKFSNEKTCAYKTLASLVELGILDSKKKLFGMKFPTVKPEYEEVLVNKIRQVALENVPPDAYIRALLLIMRAVDDFFILSDPLLRRHFSKDEYKPAKERIKALVGLGKKKGGKDEQ